MARILLIGHSHLSAIHHAFERDGEARGLFAGVEIEIARLREERFQPNLVDGALNDSVRAVLDRFGAGDTIFAATGGNAHNAFGIVNFEPRFDFHLPDRLDFAIDDGAEVLPLALVRSSIEQTARPMIDVLRAMRAASKARWFHLESPAPVPSAAHIAAYPDTYATRIAKSGIAPAPLRYKLWRLHSALYRDLCRELDMTFVPVPDETVDNARMLREVFWKRDPTHGNTAYGARVLHQINRIREPADVRAPV